MELGMVGLGRMGSNLVRRLMADGHRCVAYDVRPEAVTPVVGEGAAGASTIHDLVGALQPPRAVWVMVPAGEPTEEVVRQLAEHLEPGDVVIDGGNTNHRDDLRRARELADRGIHLVDCGTSGGLLGIQRGFCLMVGADEDVFEHLEPIFASLAAGADTAPRTRGRDGDPSPAERGYLRCGPVGAGHFVKMVHNGIEYGLMAAYAEGLNILANANAGGAVAPADAETAPLRDPEAYRYEIDVADVAEVWRRGSVVSSWLLDLTAAALHADRGLDGLEGQVADSGEGRWAAIAAIEEGVPADVLTAALFSRFSSRDRDSFANRVLSAMRLEFGGHRER
ncbi:MAG TPA: decarboxylating 6-phosphogluconate dehydrogenase [Actinomycetota bacterium]